MTTTRGWHKPQISGESPDGDCTYEIGSHQHDFYKGIALSLKDPVYIDFRFPDGTVLHHIPLKINGRVKITINIHGLDVDFALEDIEMRWCE